MRLGAVNDAEGAFVPDRLPEVVDGHVHVFPDGLFRAIWTWFDEFAWPIRYRLGSQAVIEYLLSRGIGHIVAFQYAHKPGIAQELNEYMTGLCRLFPSQITGMATVFPGEPETPLILKNAFEKGLKGVKLHAHVQCFDMNGPDMEIVYETCQSEGKPLVMHVSREPKSTAYRCDPYELCSAEKLEAVLRAFPRLNICVPHLGIDEFDAYRSLVEKYDTLWLDTAMALADYFPIRLPYRLDELREDRIMYGSDFPNIPYAWDRELKFINGEIYDPGFLKRFLSENARAFFAIGGK
ncbi:MAG: amidohydrolase family protein [Thermodesulfobacteriota bacterium]